MRFLERLAPSYCIHRLASRRSFDWANACEVKRFSGDWRDAGYSDSRSLALQGAD